MLVAVARYGVVSERYNSAHQLRPGREKGSQAPLSMQARPSAACACYSALRPPLVTRCRQAPAQPAQSAPAHARSTTPHRSLRLTFRRAPSTPGSLPDLVLEMFRRLSPKICHVWWVWICGYRREASWADYRGQPTDISNRLAGEVMFCPISSSRAPEAARRRGSHRSAHRRLSSREKLRSIPGEVRRPEPRLRPR